ncbi:P-loop ATPase, Sll1717 family [Sphaerothrix gracilis]|uniref:P-loop ATPase, Sll1717 family n=1 Tax=Sphaerothrix gracilis TaxID=3151835 RepID=UPI0031FBAA5C
MSIQAEVSPTQPNVVKYWLMRLDIHKLNLGSDSAERDIAVGLSEYFYQNSTYHKFLKSHKTILVGNRGTGKSAIFKYIALTEARKGNLILELSPEEYSYELLCEYLRSESEGSWGKQSAYSVAWQYLLYNLIFSKIAANKRGLLLGPQKDIYAYVRNNLQNQQLNSISILVNYLKRLEKAKFESQETFTKTRELQALYSLEEIKELVPSLKKVLQKTRIKILVDELDKGWDNSEDARYFIAGLFQATQKINLISSNLKVYVSIRQELFDNIPQIYDDAQKIREDVEIIRWGRDELIELLGLRIVHSFPEAKKLTSHRRWNSVFSAQLSSRREDSADYIINRTQLRPRELLQFCKLCLERHVKGNKVTEPAILAAEEMYSEQKIKDLAAEYRFQYPYLLDLFEVFRGKCIYFSKDELDLFILAIVCGDVDVDQAIWVINMDYLELKKILWHIGFLKAAIPKAAQKQPCNANAYLGHYEIPTINLENIQHFCIHPAFASFLSLKN